MTYHPVIGLVIFFILAGGFSSSGQDVTGPAVKAAGIATDVIREGLEGSPLVWPKAVGAVKLMQDLVDQLALAIQGGQDAKTSLGKAQETWEKELA